MNGPNLGVGIGIASTGGVGVAVGVTVGGVAVGVGVTTSATASRFTTEAGWFFVSSWLSAGSPAVSGRLRLQPERQKSKPPTSEAAILTLNAVSSIVGMLVMILASDLHQKQGL